MNKKFVIVGDEAVISITGHIKKPYVMNVVYTEHVAGLPIDLPEGLFVFAGLPTFNSREDALSHLIAMAQRKRERLQAEAHKQYQIIRTTTRKLYGISQN